MAFISVVSLIQFKLSKDGSHVNRDDPGCLSTHCCSFFACCKWLSMSVELVNLSFSHMSFSLAYEPTDMKIWCAWTKLPTLLIPSHMSAHSLIDLYFCPRRASCPIIRVARRNAVQVLPFQCLHDPFSVHDPNTRDARSLGHHDRPKMPFIRLSFRL